MSLQIILQLKDEVGEGLKSSASVSDRRAAVRRAYELEQKLMKEQRRHLLLLPPHNHIDAEVAGEEGAYVDKVDFGEFEKWLDENQVEHDKVRFGYIEELQCNGVVCCKDIDKAQAVLKVPSKLILSAENLAAGSTGYVWKDVLAHDELLSAMPQLALVLALMSEVYVADGSFFHPYIQVLPKKYPSLPLTWTPEQLDLLQGSSLEVESLKRRLNGWAFYCYVYELIRRVQGELKGRKVRQRQWPVFFRKFENFTLELFMWALCAVTTRQNNLTSSDGRAEVLSLVPVYDMCNHEDGVYSTDFATAGVNRELICSAFRAFKKGEEFRIFYGTRPNAELLMYAGFVMKPGTNSHDFVKLPQELPEDDALFGIKKLILAKLGYQGTKPVFKIAGPNQAEGLHALTKFTRVRMLTKEEATDVLKMIHEADDVSALLNESLTPRNEEATHQYLQTLLTNLSTSRAKALKALESAEAKDPRSATNLPLYLSKTLLQNEAALIDMAKIMQETAAMNLNHAHQPTATNEQRVDGQ